MRHLSLALSGIAILALAPHAPASAEPYEEYLSRLRNVCEVDCLQPRQFQRAARKRDSGDIGDMAVIMDVVDVRKNGKKYQLLSMNLESNPLLDREVLGSAGINTSGSNGIGGLPRSQQGGNHPNLIIVEIEEDALFDFLNAASPSVEGVIATRGGEEGIVVEGDREREFVEPSLRSLRTYFRNRRVVVRGQPRLAAVFIGARRDFRRKQVTLEVAEAANIVLLPRYDEDGEPVLFDQVGE